MKTTIAFKMLLGAAFLNTFLSWAYLYYRTFWGHVDVDQLIASHGMTALILWLLLLPVLADLFRGKQ